MEAAVTDKYVRLLGLVDLIISQDYREFHHTTGSFHLLNKYTVMYILKILFQ